LLTRLKLRLAELDRARDSGVSFSQLVFAAEFEQTFFINRGPRPDLLLPVSPN